MDTSETLTRLRLIADGDYPGDTLQLRDVEAVETAIDWLNDKTHMNRIERKLDALLRLSRLNPDVCCSKCGGYNLTMMWDKDGKAMRGCACGQVDLVGGDTHDLEVTHES